jgi:hypothetical protein
MRWDDEVRRVRTQPTPPAVTNVAGLRVPCDLTPGWSLPTTGAIPLLHLLLVAPTAEGAIIREHAGNKDTETLATGAAEAAVGPDETQGIATVLHAHACSLRGLYGRLPACLGRSGRCADEHVTRAARKLHGRRAACVQCTQSRDPHDLLQPPLVYGR